MTADYDASVSGYLARCKELRSAGTLRDLRYAALELRLGLETLLAECVEADEELAALTRNKWRAAQLTGAMNTGNRRRGDEMSIVHLQLFDPTEVIAFQYFPVTDRLMESVGRLGDFLHRNARIERGADGVMDELRGLVRDAYADLLLANASELAGLPRINPVTGGPHLVLRLPPGDPRVTALQAAITAGRKHEVNFISINPIGQPTFYEDDKPSADV